MNPVNGVNPTKWYAIREFVAEQCSVPADRLQPSTTLLGDLGVDGDDAVLLFTEFGRRFSVDLSHFDLTQHFGPEGWPLRYLFFAPLRMLWTARPGDPHKKAGVVPVRLEQLVAAAEQGRWISSPIHGEKWVPVV